MGISLKTSCKHGPLMIDFVAICNEMLILGVSMGISLQKPPGEKAPRDLPETSQRALPKSSPRELPESSQRAPRDIPETSRREAPREPPEKSRETPVSSQTAPPKEAQESCATRSRRAPGELPKRPTPDWSKNIAQRELRWQELRTNGADPYLGAKLLKESSTDMKCLIQGRPSLAARKLRPHHHHHRRHRHYHHYHHHHHHDHRCVGPADCVQPLSW